MGTGGRVTRPRFFKSLAEWRTWLRKNHASKTEIVLGMYKSGASRKGLTRQEMVDGALAYGWIDGHLRSLGAEAYQIRLSPRRKGSNWSAVNVKRVGELIEKGEMEEPGLAAFRNRGPANADGYSLKVGTARFTPAQVKQLRAVPKAHAFFRERPPGYRNRAIFWVNAAKQEATRARRMKTLIEDSAAGKRLKHLVSPVAEHKRKKAVAG
jgi:uncharacterized protein YdeI (YjbR/CyaY-like superfamily)